MFTNPEPEYDDERVTKLVKDLTDELRKIGIYGVEAQILRHPSSPLPMIAMTATVGEVAKSDRVLDPEQHELRSNFREVERDINQSALEEAREKMRAAGGIFGDDEDGDDE